MHFPIYVINYLPSKTMSRRLLKEKNIRKITKVGRGSFAVTIPIEMIGQLGWRERQKVTVKKSGQKIIIEDWEE